MNIFKNLPFSKSEPEIDPAQEKKERILFHREHVRNGPIGRRRVRQDHHALAVSFSESGQTRRARREARKSIAQNYERAKAVHFSELREAAILRGQLQAVGLLPYITPENHVDPRLARTAVIYLIHRFADAEGTVIVTEDLVRDSLQSALNRWQAIVRRPATDIPADYVLPVQVAV